MSISTTTTVPTGVNELLRAYDLHHSGTEISPSQNVDQVMQTRRQPENARPWPTDRRRMPEYREASRTHDLADRPAGETATEGVVASVMFLGVFVNSVSEFPSEAHRE
jgi:hypothetical protein